MVCHEDILFPVDLDESFRSNGNVGDKIISVEFLYVGVVHETQFVEAMFLDEHGWRKKGHSLSERSFVSGCRLREDLDNGIALPPVVIEDDLHDNYLTGFTLSEMVKEDKSPNTSGSGLILLSPGVM